MFRTTVGNVEVIAFSDGLASYEASAVYPDAGAGLEPYRALLDTEGKVTLNHGCYLLRADGRTVLVDTGNGPTAQGTLMAEMQAAGVGPGDVDVVLFTHLHGDHTGWNIDPDTGLRRFPRARYLVPRGDWDDARARETPPRSFGRDIAPLERLGVMELIEGERAVTPSLVTLPTPGHTRGHTTVVVSSQGQQAYVCGDAFLTVLDVTEPTWVSRWDGDAEAVRATRRLLGERIAAHDALVAASHLPLPGLGRFVMVDGKRYWRGVA